MNCYTLRFPAVPHTDGTLAHHLKVGPFPSNFCAPSVLDPFFRADEDLGYPRELVDVFKIEIVYLTCVKFQVQIEGAYPLGIDYPPDAVELFIIALI